MIVGTTYKFRIVARNAINTSLFSETGSALAASAPAMPAKPTKKSANSSEIVIQWTAPDSRGSIVTNYEVYWDAGSGATPRTLLTTTTNVVFEASTTFAVSDLNDGETYKFAIRAINNIGASQYSSTTLLAAATIPSIPDTPTVTTASSASITIEWTEPASGGASITNYHVYEAEGENPSDIDFVFVADTFSVQSYSKVSSV